jgi:protein O-mannosyl-transferase
MIRSMATQPGDGAIGQQMVEPTQATKTYFVDTTWLLVFALVVVTILAYQPVWHAGFIWDDDVLITDNPMVKASDGLYRFWFTTEAPDYWPLTSTVWWLEWRMWGDHAAGYHVFNVLLHVVNAILVWLILRRLKVLGAWLAALVFAIHPVNVATVAWIAELKNTLSMFFYAIAILLYLRFDETNQRRWYGLSLTAFFLALLSKTVAVMLPIVLLGCVWWRRGRLQWKDILRSVPFFGLSLVLGVVTIWFQHNRAMALGGLSVPTSSILSHVAAAGSALWFYLYKAVLPWNLCAIYPKWNIDTSHWVSYLAGLILVSCVTMFWWKPKCCGRPVLFGLGYFLVVLFPVLGFFRISFHEYSPVADQWQYHAIVGVIALVTATGVAIYRRLGNWEQSAVTLVSVAGLMVLGAATWSRASVYAGSETLWRDTVAKNPNSWVAHFNLGNALLHAGRLEDAIRQYEQAVQIDPHHQEVHNNLAFALLQAGRVNDAIAQLEQAVRISPDSADGHYNLGNAYLRAGRVQDATGQYEQAVRLNPNYVQAHVNLGFALAQRGRFDEAVEHWEAALRLDPSNQDAPRGLERVRRIRASSAFTP